MRVGLPSTGPLADRLEVLTIRESSDPNISVPWAVCIKRPDDTLVESFSLNHMVGIDPDVKLHTLDISLLPEGVYKVEIYNWVNCDAPTYVDKLVTFIHRKTTGTVQLRMHVDWYPEHNRIFTMYVFDGKLFYQTTSSRVVWIPRNADVFVEVTGSDGNAYVNIVNSSTDLSVMPNGGMPFTAEIRITFDRPVAWRVANSIDFNVIRSVAVSVVDDYTLKLIITKNEVGIGLLAAVILVFAMALGIAVVGAVIVGLIASVEFGRQATLNKLIDERDNVVDRYIEEVENCTDEQCISNVQRKYLPIINSISSSIGSLVSKEDGNGLKIGGITIPWYVVAVLVLVIGLMIVATLR